MHHCIAYGTHNALPMMARCQIIWQKHISALLAPITRSPKQGGLTPNRPHDARITQRLCVIRLNLPRSLFFASVDGQIIELASMHATVTYVDIRAVWLYLANAGDRTALGKHQGAARIFCVRVLEFLKCGARHSDLLGYSRIGVLLQKWVRWALCFRSAAGYKIQ